MDCDLTLLNLNRALGPLEAEVIEVVWRQGEATVREVHREFLNRRDIAYTTVLTVLRNLTRKGLLSRRREGRAYVYAATVSKEEFTRARVAHIVDLLLEEFREPALARFQEWVGGRLQRRESQS